MDSIRFNPPWKEMEKLPDLLEGLRPNQRKECEWCGKIRWVKNLVTVQSPYKVSPEVVCTNHRQVWY